ncbi:uncharacterized protein DUF3140 [Labedella gwakjiensis]|uniref:Uncharacterized protein DUF3140 n=2 Tax=Labedella gwakjiensis TaxID=390269 RepID=A0A2P8GYE0_9MICO|nr:uncharacterized protein DUF3140 [Labedella gwakjiensis]
MYAAPRGDVTPGELPVTTTGPDDRKPPGNDSGVVHDRRMSDKHDDADDIRHDFDDAVNMTPSELSDWLDTDESKAVGQKNGGSESTGHRSGRRIVELLRTKKDDLSDSDLSHMKKVVGYVSRHRAQRPSGDISETDWRYSLMNWGHDPLK